MDGAPVIGIYWTVHKSVEQSDVVVFTHPWVFPLAKHLLKDKVVVYDAHNFEYGLRSRLLSSSFAGRRLAANVKRVEGELVRRSNDVWVCSGEDADAMVQTYGAPRERFHLMPNCADTRLWSGERKSTRRGRDCGAGGIVTSRSSSVAVTAPTRKRLPSLSINLLRHSPTWSLRLREA